MQQFKILFAAVTGIAAVRLEFAVPLICFVIVAMLFDYITGLLAGMRQSGLNSKTATKGLYKKSGFLLLLLFGFFLDIAIPYFIQAGLNVTVPFSLPFGLILAAWIVITEGISVVENLINLDVNVPKWLINMLKKTQEQIDTQVNPK